MKLDGIRSELAFYSGKVSDLARQLALAGIAVVWLFKVDRAGQTPAIPQELVAPMFLLVVTALADFLQYAYGTVAYHIRYETAERQMKKDQLPADHNFKVSRVHVLRFMDVMFYLKIATVIIAYALLARFILGRLIT